MKSMAAVKPDMALLSQEQLTQASFGALCQSFAMQILGRRGYEDGLYQRVALEFLEEAPPEAQQPVKNIFNIDLSLVLETIRQEAQSQRREKKETEKLLEQIIRVQQEAERQRDTVERRSTVERYYMLSPRHTTITRQNITLHNSFHHHGAPGPTAPPARQAKQLGRALLEQAGKTVLEQAGKSFLRQTGKPVPKQAERPPSSPAGVGDRELNARPSAPGSLGSREAQQPAQEGRQFSLPGAADAAQAALSQSQSIDLTGALFHAAQSELELRDERGEAQPRQDAEAITRAVERRLRQALQAADGEPSGQRPSEPRPPRDITQPATARQAPGQTTTENTDGARETPVRSEAYAAERERGAPAQADSRSTIRPSAATQPPPAAPAEGDVGKPLTSGVRDIRVAGGQAESAAALLRETAAPETQPAAFDGRGQEELALRREEQPPQQGVQSQSKAAPGRETRRDDCGPEHTGEKHDPQARNRRAETVAKDPRVLRQSPASGAEAPSVGLSHAAQGRAQAETAQPVGLSHPTQGRTQADAAQPVGLSHPAQGRTQADAAQPVGLSRPAPGRTQAETAQPVGLSHPAQGRTQTDTAQPIDLSHPTHGQPQTDTAQIGGVSHGAQDRTQGEAAQTISISGSGQKLSQVTAGSRDIRVAGEGLEPIAAQAGQDHPSLGQSTPVDDRTREELTLRREDEAPATTQPQTQRGRELGSAAADRPSAPPAGRETPSAHRQEKRAAGTALPQGDTVRAGSRGISAAGGRPSPAGGPSPIETRGATAAPTAPATGIAAHASIQPMASAQPMTSAQPMVSAAKPPTTGRDIRVLPEERERQLSPEYANLLQIFASDLSEADLQFLTEGQLAQLARSGDRPAPQRVQGGQQPQGEPASSMAQMAAFEELSHREGREAPPSQPSARTEGQPSRPPARTEGQPSGPAAREPGQRTSGIPPRAADIRTLRQLGGQLQPRLGGAPAPLAQSLKAAHDAGAGDQTSAPLAMLLPSGADAGRPQRAQDGGNAVRQAGTPAQGDEGQSPMELTYSPAMTGQQGYPPGAPAVRDGGTVQSAYVNSLPGWAQSFVKGAASSQQPAGAATLAPMAGAARGIASLPGPAAGTVERMVDWTSPRREQLMAQAARRPAEITFKESPREEQPSRSPQLTESELRHTADKVYKMIEDRIRRERRLLGL